MNIFSQDEVLKILDAYNPWWKTGMVSRDDLQDMKRLAFYSAKEILIDNEIRRFVVLSGARRVGKTTILYQLINELLNKKINKENIIYISLDNPVLKFGNLKEILDIYIQSLMPKGKIYIFLDEIQYSEDWNSWLKVFYDTNKSWRIVATGSASPALEKGSTESGVGRWVTISVPTLSFYEYCVLVHEKTKITGSDIVDAMKELPKEAKEELLKAENVDQVADILISYKSVVEKIRRKIPKDFTVNELEKMTTKEFKDLISSLEIIKEDFNRYLLIGGFPELALSENDNKAQKILREDIVDKVLKRDIPSLFKIRNITVLEKVFLYLCFESSNIINYSNISKSLEVSIQTIQEYISYLEEANLIYISYPINKSGTKILKSNPKIYIVDSAIRNAVLMKQNILTDTTEMGHVVETAVYRHMLSYIQKTTGRIGYYRDKKGKEIDIVSESVKENMYVEVKYREASVVAKDNPLYEQAEKDDRLFIVNKNDFDSGIITLKNGKKLVKIPAYAFLFLLGLEEANNI